MQEGPDQTNQGLTLPPSEFTFSLRKNSERDATAVEVSFAAGQGEEAGPHDSFGSAFPKAFPVFNDDGKHFTPSFMLPYDKARTPNNLQAFQLLHKNRVYEIVQQKQQLFVPQPAQANRFCCICKSYFDDYLHHTLSPAHAHALANNPFRQHIAVFCLGFSSERGGARGKEKKKEKEKRIRKGKGRGKARGKEIFCSVSTEVQVSPLQECPK